MSMCRSPSCYWEARLSKMLMTISIWNKRSNRANPTSKEVNRRIRLGWTAFGKLHSVFSFKIPQSLKTKPFDLMQRQPNGFVALYVQLVLHKNNYNAMFLCPVSLALSTYDLRSRVRPKNMLLVFFKSSLLLFQKHTTDIKNNPWIFLMFQLRYSACGHRPARLTVLQKFLNYLQILDNNGTFFSQRVACVSICIVICYTSRVSVLIYVGQSSLV